VDQEVAKTLGELELKLQELERELTSIGRRGNTQPSKPQAPGKLIDEAIEREVDSGSRAESDERERAVDNAFGGPAMFGGEEVPAQGATIERDSAFPVSETAYGEIATGTAPLPASSLPSTPSFPTGVFAPTTPHTPQPGPPLPPPGPAPEHSPPVPAPRPPLQPEPIDRAELVRFREKLQRTMEDLLDEYSRLLLPKPPA
jgi:hypothetical protein